MIITAASKDYKRILELSTIQNKKLGYNPTIYDIEGTMSIGEVFNLNDFYKKIDANKLESKDMVGVIPYKPLIIKSALNKYKQNITWMDADAFAIKNYDKVFNDDFDIAFTMRRQNEKATPYPLWSGFINAGVIFFKYNANTLKFIDLWIEEINNTMYFSDQEAINRLVLRCSELNESCYGNIFNLDGIKIKILTTDEYNYYYYPKRPDYNTKILHLKTNIRQNNDILNWFEKDWNKFS
jgi:hypothetical protein